MFLRSSVASCASSRGFQARAYVDDRPRVDQKMDDGNYGYFSGTPAHEDRSGMKTTRKIYVLEFSKEVEGEEDVIAEVEDTITSPAPIHKRPRAEHQPLVIPDFGDAAVDGHKDPSFIDYEVKKDDTLQKISKKFYDNYSKWPRIFDANKDMMKDPNRLKPGMVIRVPVE